MVAAVRLQPSSGKDPSANANNCDGFFEIEAELDFSQGNL